LPILQPVHVFYFSRNDRASLRAIDIHRASKSMTACLHCPIRAPWHLGRRRRLTGRETRHLSRAPRRPTAAPRLSFHHRGPRRRDALCPDGFDPAVGCLKALSLASAEFSRHRDVRFGSKADISSSPPDVRFTPESGQWRASLRCPPGAKSRHRAVTRSVELIVQSDAHDVVGGMGARGEGARKRCGRRLAQPGQSFQNKGNPIAASMAAHSATITVKPPNTTVSSSIIGRY
jgi:hypothetical protein